MHDLAFIRERIESYADYTNADGARLADEQIRAYVGEAVSRLAERLPRADIADVLARVLLRCQFADQAVVRALQTGARTAAEFAALSGADRELVALADRADSLPGADVVVFVADVSAAFDERKRIIVTSGAVSAPYPPL